MADDAEKTEAATPKKKEDARKKGQVLQSRDVSTVLLLAAGAFALASPLGASLAKMVVEAMQRMLSGVLIQPGTIADYHALLLDTGLLVAVAMAPFAVIFMAIGTLGNVAQIGFMISGEAMAPKFEKMNPITGIKRLVSLDKLYELAKSLLRLTMVVAILWWFLAPAMTDVFELIGAETVSVGIVGARLLQRTTWMVLAVFVVFAVIDYAWQKYQYEKKLRMSKQEIRDENKQREGDPKVKSRIRQIQREVAQQRMFDAISEADVVVVNPTHYAVALQYRPPLQTSPKVLAKGRGYVALRIRRRAEELGIPVVENKPVAQLLYKTAKVDREIPEKLYQAVAEVLAYLYKLDPKRANRWRTA